MAWTRSLPTIHAETAAYWEAAKRGKILLQKCRDCGKFQHFYRADFCSHCWSRDIEDVDASGKGTVWTYSVIYMNRTPGMEKDVPYVAAQIELEEGVGMVSNVINCDPESVTVGMPVKVTFQEASPNVSIAFFEPA